MPKYYTPRINKAIRIACISWISTLNIGASLSARAEEPVNLQQLLAIASANHPSVVAARLEVEAAKFEVTAAERQRWPELSAVIESNINNEISGTQTRFLRIQKNIWDGGRISARITETETLVDIGKIKIDLQRQQLSIQIATAWQSLLNANERATVAHKTIDRLKLYRAQLQRRVDAEASPRIDLELADSRLLQTAVELNTAQSAGQVAINRLEQLTGETSLQVRVGRPDIQQDLSAARHFAVQLEQTDLALVAYQHLAVSKAQTEARQIRNRLQAKEAERWPQIYLRVDQPVGTSSNYANNRATAYAGISYTPGAGFSNLIEAKAIALRISSQDQVVEIARREIHETLQADRTEFSNSQIRAQALIKSTQGAELVLKSYERQFQAGRKTWQDLLNAVRELAQNEYSLVDTQASFIGAMYRLEIRMGQ